MATPTTDAYATPPPFPNPPAAATTLAAAPTAPISSDDIENNTRLFRATQQALALKNENRPKNTRRAYEPKQREFVVRIPRRPRRPSCLGR